MPATRSIRGRGVAILAVLGVTACGGPTAPPVATQLAFSQQPTDATAGGAISPALQVEIRDANGNLVARARDPVTLAIGTNPPGGTLFGTKTVSAVGGIATFAGLSIDKAGSGYTLVASSGSLASATSAAFGISPAAVTQLLFTTEPPATVEGNVPLSPPVRVTLQDAFGNVVPTGTVTMSLDAGPWAGSALAGTLTASAASGVATFVDLRVDEPGFGYRLRASLGSAVAISAAFAAILTPSALAAGYAHTCAITVGGAYCWGKGSSGELGSVGLVSDSVPHPVAGGLTFVELSGGLSYTCGRTSSGAGYCWGANSVGELGNGSTTNSFVPVQVSGSGTAPLAFTSVGAGAGHTCGLVVGGAVYCWGAGIYGQLGNGTTTNSSTPVQVSGSGTAPLIFTTVGVGDFHTCGVTTDQAIYCWGQNVFGQLGNGSTTNSAAPVQVTASGTAPLTFTTVSGGNSHTCGVTTGNEAYCWGNNFQGQLGNGTTTSSATPVQVSTAFGALQAVSAGGFHTCAVGVRGGVACWGANSFGQLGDGTTTDRSTPLVVDIGGVSPTTVVAEGNHTCGWGGLVGSAAYCWGSNVYGELGIGTLAVAQSSRPVRIVQ